MNTVHLTPFQIERRRAAAAEAIGHAVIATADLDALMTVLRATFAQSADDRGDDLCNVFVRCPLSDADVARIEGRSADGTAMFPEVSGPPYDAPRAWAHSWTRRRVRRGGAEVVLDREAWLRENALCILRAGGVEVRTPGAPWTRVAPEADYRAIGLVAADLVTEPAPARAA